MSTQTSARLEAATSFWERASAESSDLDRIYPWLYQAGMSNAMTGDWSAAMPQLQGTPEEAEAAMRERQLEYLDERRASLSRFAADGEIDQSAADEQLAEVRRVRDHLIEAGVELYGFACTCSPAELEAMDAASELISLRAIEPFGNSGSYGSPIPPVDLSIRD